MNPKNNTNLDEERTEVIPAQARDAVAGESGFELPADQVYAQRLAETPLNDGIPNIIFVP